jgi:hypothetical protein
MNEIEARINDLVASFVTEITRMARSAALDTLNRALAGGPPAPPRRGRPPGVRNAVPAAQVSTDRGGSHRSSANLGKGEKRPKVEIAKMQEQVLAHIRANPGQRIEQINKLLGTNTPQLSLPLKKLIASGAVNTKGARRATSYFPGKRSK